MVASIIPCTSIFISKLVIKTEHYYNYSIYLSSLLLTDTTTEASQEKIAMLIDKLDTNKPYPEDIVYFGAFGVALQRECDAAIDISTSSAEALKKSERILRQKSAN